MGRPTGGGISTSATPPIRLGFATEDAVSRTLDEMIELIGTPLFFFSDETGDCLPNSGQPPMRTSHFVVFGLFQYRATRSSFSRSIVPGSSITLSWNEL